MRRLVSATLAIVLLAAAPVRAADPPAAEGALDASIDTESSNPSVLLRAMQQEQFSLEEYTYQVLFNQQYGDHISADRVVIPTVDAGTEPAVLLRKRQQKHTRANE